MLLRNRKTVIQKTLKRTGRRGIEPSRAARKRSQPGRRRQSAALALALALQPIVDVCLELGVTSPEMERILRGVFVDRAEFALAQNSTTRKAKASDLKIGLMTGVHRNFVNQIRATRPHARLQQVQGRHRGDALLGAWSTEGPYLTSAASPRDLPIKGPEGVPSFGALVSRYMPGVRPSTAITELRRSGAIQLLPDERVRLRSSSVGHRGISAPSVAAAGSKLSRLARNLMHNLRSADQSWFCKTVELRSIDERRIPMIRQTIAKRSQSFLDVLANEFTEEKTSNAVDAGVPFG